MDTKNRFFSNADLRKLIIPLIIDQFLQAFVGLADSIMVASVGEAAVSGVSLIDTRRGCDCRAVFRKKERRNGLQIY